MTPDDAQASLDDIQRRQDQSLDEYVRHSSSRRYLLISALTLLTMFAALDLRRPWSTAAYVFAWGLLAVVGIVHWRQAPVRRRQRGAERSYLMGVAGGLALAVSVFSLIAGVLNHWFGLPAPHTVAGAAVVLLYIAIIELSRPAYRAIVRRAGRRG